MKRTFLWVIFFSTKKEDDNLSTEVKETGKKSTEISKKRTSSHFLKQCGRGRGKARRREK